MQQGRLGMINYRRHHS